MEQAGELGLRFLRPEVHPNIAERQGMSVTVRANSERQPHGHVAADPCLPNKHRA
jgi:hypothetical protein